VVELLSGKHKMLSSNPNTNNNNNNRGGGFNNSVQAAPDQKEAGKKATEVAGLIIQSKLHQIKRRQEKKKRII
jgi:hypothetical protein